MTGLRSAVRVLVMGWWLQLKIVAVNAFDGVLNIVYPLFFATTALLMYRQSGSPQALVYAALGAAVMGTWSAMATSASGALQSQRWQGTLELLVSSPTRMALAILPITAALATARVDRADRRKRRRRRARAGGSPGCGCSGCGRGG